MAVIALPSFSKGEIAPSLHARVDTAMYKTALRKARNAIIHPYGGISNRPGTVCIGPVKDHTVSTTRLFRFHLGDTDQYVLEFGSAYMRVIRNDLQVLNASTNITAITAANPVVVTAASHGLSNGDEVVLGSIGGMIQVNLGRYIVREVTTNTVELTDQVTGNNIDGTTFTAFTSGGTIASVFELVTPYAVGDLSTLKIVQTGNVLTVTHPTYAPRDITRTDHNAWTITTLTFAPTISAPTNLAATADTNTNFTVFETRNQTVRYEVTSIEDTDQFFEESLAVQVTLTDSSDPPLNTLTWTAQANADRYAVYRQDNGLFGLIGETEAVTFEDDNFAADLTVSPPRSRNPFSGSGNFPATSGYYEQRQLYGGSTNNPDTMYASQTGLRLNMSVSSPLQADDAITANFSAQDVQIIRHFVPLDDLIVFTNAGEWRVNSGGDSSFSADTIKFKPQEFWGSDHMQPIVFGNTVLYVEDGGGRVRSLGFSFQSDGYNSSDMNLLANHLLVEDGPDEFIISDWTSQQFPEPRLYIVRSDGQCLTMTFNQEQEVIAWTTWDTKGEYESATSLRRSLSNVEDGVYFIVKRFINGNTVRFIERMHTRKFADVRDTFFLDAGAQFDSPVVITDITTANPAVLTATAHGFSDGDEVEITGIEWVKDVDSLGNETNPAQFNDQRFTLTNTQNNANFFELLKRSWGSGSDIDIGTFAPDTSFNLVQHTGEPRAAIFSNDGLKMFTLDVGGNQILEYNLSIAFDIATATHNSVVFDFSAITTDARGMAFTTTAGTTILLGGQAGAVSTLFELTLSTGFDLSTTSDSGRSANIDAQVDEMFDIDTDRRGTRVYVTAGNRNIFTFVFQFSITGSNISTLTYNNISLDTTNVARKLRSAFMRKNGTQLFLLDDRLINSILVHEYKLSTPYEISTAVFQSTITLSQVSCARSLSFKDNDDEFDINTAISYTNERFEGQQSEVVSTALAFRPDGTRYYELTGTSADEVDEYTLSTAWDVSTATYASRTFDFSATVVDPVALSFRDDGTKMFIMDRQGGVNIEQYTLSTAWNVDTATADGIRLDISTENDFPYGMFFREDGLRVYTANDSSGGTASVFQYNLTSPWDLGTGSYSGNTVSTNAEDTFPRAVNLNGAGTKMFVTGGTNERVYQYTLSTAWDVSTATYDSINFDINTIPTIQTPQGTVFKPAGDKIFFVDNNNADVYAVNVDTTATAERKMYVTQGCATPAIFQFGLDKTINDESHSNTEIYFRGGEARVTTNIISGLAGLHCLNGENVSILADGSVEPDQTISNSTITIADSRRVARAAIGLPFTTDIETLNIEVASPPSTVQDKQKKITDVLVRFYKSRMPFIGPDSNNLVEMKGREFEKYGEATALLSGDRTVNIPPSWNSNGRLFIRMRAPVPLTILGLFPDITAEDSLE